MVHDLSKTNSILNQFVAELRDVEVQKDPLRFRKNLERIGQIFAYEISKQMTFYDVDTTTPLGVAETRQLMYQPVIATILRAGLPLHHGLLSFFDHAQNAFASAFRKHHKNNTVEVAVDYVACPDINGKLLILCDPMLASGTSMVLTYKALLANGLPEHTHIVVAIASSQGIDFLQKHMPTQKYTLWCGAVDDELTAQSYIVPGLGDAGDLAFGSKR